MCAHFVSRFRSGTLPLGAPLAELSVKGPVRVVRGRVRLPLGGPQDTRSACLWHSPSANDLGVTSLNTRSD